MALYFIQHFVIEVQGLHQPSQHKPSTTSSYAPRPLGSHSHFLPPKPSSFGKQFGQDHARVRIQERLLVKHLQVLCFLPILRRASPLPRRPLGKFPAYQGLGGTHWLSSTCRLQIGSRLHPRRKSQHAQAAVRVFEIPAAKVSSRRVQLPFSSRQPSQLQEHGTKYAHARQCGIGE